VITLTITGAAVAKVGIGGSEARVAHTETSVVALGAGVGHERILSVVAAVTIIRASGAEANAVLLGIVPAKNVASLDTTIDNSPDGGRG
jgi:uncharacterized protein YjlB